MNEQKSLKITVNTDVEAFIKESNLKTIIKNYATRLFKEKGVRIPNLKVEKDEKLTEGQAVLFINEKLYKRGRQARIKSLIKMMDSRLYEFVTPEDIDERVQKIVEEFPYIKREMQSKKINVLFIHRVVQTLAKEGVTINPLKKIIDSLLYHSDNKKELDELIFNIRTDIFEHILSPYVRPDGYVDALSLRKIEAKSETYCFQGEFHLSFTNQQEREVINQVKFALKELTKEGITPVLIVNYFATRAALSRLFANHGIKAPVLTTHEATITNSEYKGLRYIGEFEEEVEQEEDKERLREKILNLALELDDEELFKKISSDDWEKYL